MKKTMTVSVFTLLLVGSINAQIWGHKKIKENGNITTETRSTLDYNGIKCAGNMNFILVKGNEGQIKLEGEFNLLEYVVTEIKKGDLIVKVKKNYSLKASRDKAIKITIPFQDIDRVSLAGSGDVKSEDQINANDFGVSLSGSGDIVLNVEANNMKSSLAGSGDIILKGSTDTFKVSLAGSGDIRAFNLKANNVTASIAGSGDIEVHSNVSLKASVAGSGDIEYIGNPEVTKKVAGSGSVSKN